MIYIQVDTIKNILLHSKLTLTQINDSQYYGKGNLKE